MLHLLVPLALAQEPLTIDGVAVGSTIDPSEWTCEDDECVRPVTFAELEGWLEVSTCGGSVTGLEFHRYYTNRADFRDLGGVRTAVEYTEERVAEDYRALQALARCGPRAFGHDGGRFVAASYACGRELRNVGMQRTGSRRDPKLVIVRYGVAPASRSCAE